MYLFVTTHPYLYQVGGVSSYFKSKFFIIQKLKIFSLSTRFQGLSASSYNVLQLIVLQK
jgi:hypothetical protein